MASIDNTPQTGRSITIHPDDTSLSVAQAIYHHVTAKTERIFEAHSDFYVIKEDDIHQIIHKIKQVAQRHHQEEWSCVIDHALFKKERTRHSSFEKFKYSDRSQPDPTSEIVITYDFLSQNPFTMPQDDIKPERYKIVINISQEQYLLAMDSDDSRPGFLRRLHNFPTVTVNIQYVDYTIARSLLAATREWVSGLESSKRSKMTNFLLRHQFSMADILPIVFLACLLLGFAGLITSGSAGVDTSFLLRALAASALFYGLGSLLAENLANSIYFTQFPTVICFTRGDLMHYEKIRTKRSHAYKVLTFIFFGIAFTIAINLFSSFIYDLIK